LAALLGMLDTNGDSRIETSQPQEPNADHTGRWLLERRLSHRT
jgi:hypothetical protein